MQNEGTEVVLNAFKAIYFSGPMDALNISKLIEDIDKTLETTYQVHLYFESQGGSESSLNVLLDFIEKRKDRIILYGIEYLFSAGLILFIKATCEVYLLGHVYGMAHFADMPISLRDMGRNTTLDSMIKVHDDRISKKEYLKMYKDFGLNKNELEVIKRGEDLYIKPQRMKQLFKEKEKQQVCVRK